MISYPNQRTVTIRKPKYTGNFLQVNIDEWCEAYCRLQAKSSFGLYLYLRGNQDGFPLALSSAAIQNALNISDSSYRRAVEDLLGEGYLIMRNDNKHALDFYTSPQPTNYVKKERKKKITGGGRTEAEPVSVDAAPSEEPPYEKSYHRTYSSSSAYGWDFN